MFPQNYVLKFCFSVSEKKKKKQSFYSLVIICLIPHLHGKKNKNNKIH
jgi:hypothetical protein